MIELQSIEKRFGAVAALAGLSLRAEDGRVTGLLGPNGAGKTTALRAISGLLRPDAGSVRVDGVDPATDPLAARRRLGVVPDDAGLYERLTAREHLELAARLHGLGGAAGRAAVEATIAELGIAGLASRRTAGFSRGERRKVALARAIVHRPANVVLDEPTEGLDVMAIRALRRQVRGLAERGSAVLFSSHAMAEVAAVCDAVVVVAGGRAVAAGTPAEVVAASGERDLESAVIALVGGAEGLE